MTSPITQDTNLKPCPFCGGTNLYITCETEDREGTPAQITCEKCGAGGPCHYIQDPDILNDLYMCAVKTGLNNRSSTMSLYQPRKPEIPSPVNLRSDGANPYDASGKPNLNISGSASETTEQKLQRLDAYDEELSKVMPPDFKDWWQNNKVEWPLIARFTIERLREELLWYQDVVDKLHL